MLMRTEISIVETMLFVSSCINDSNFEMVIFCFCLVIKINIRRNEVKMMVI